MDGFLHNAEIITITGRSYRLRDRSGKTAPPEKSAVAAEAESTE